MVSNNHYAECIRLEDDGMSFTVLDQEELQSKLFVLERNERNSPTSFTSFVKRVRPEVERAQVCQEMQSFRLAARSFAIIPQSTNHKRHLILRRSRIYL